MKSSDLSRSWVTGERFFLVYLIFPSHMWISSKDIYPVTFSVPKICCLRYNSKNRYLTELCVLYPFRIDRSVIYSIRIISGSLGVFISLSEYISISGVDMLCFPFISSWGHEQWISFIRSFYLYSSEEIYKFEPHKWYRVPRSWTLKKRAIKVGFTFWSKS